MAHLTKTHKFTLNKLEYGDMTINSNTCKGFLGLQNGLSVWFTKLHNHGEDLIWQLSRRQSLTPFTRRVKTQTFITKEAVSQSAVSKHVNRKLSGRKRCTTNRENRSLMRIVKQNRFKNLGELHEEWTEAGFKASRAPHTDVSRNLATVVIRGVLPVLREEELDCCPVVQSPLFRWEQVLYFIWKPRS